MDYLSLPTDSSKVTMNSDYRMFLMVPGDGHVSFIEDICFGMIGPCVSFLLFMDILKDGVKFEDN